MRHLNLGSKIPLRMDGNIVEAEITEIYSTAKIGKTKELKETKYTANIVGTEENIEFTKADLQNKSERFYGIGNYYEDGQKKYFNTSCPFGYEDCIRDRMYIKHNYPDWWKSMGCPTTCEGCKNGSNYDDEDK